MAKKPRVPGWQGVMLAQTYNPDKHNVTGWLASEKLDGVRAFWDGKQLISRTGVVFTAPKFFTKGFPKYRLDGELYLGRGRFQETSSIVRTEDDTNLRWMNLQYMVFDAPDRRSLCVDSAFDTDYLKAITFWDVPENPNWITRKFDEVVSKGGEGLMFRNPEADYEYKRSWNLLKFKPEDELDAVVYGTTEGKGKHKGRIGALKVTTITQEPLSRVPLGTLNNDPLPAIGFEVGSGLTDEERELDPASWEDKIIRVAHMGFTDAGVPRFPTFRGIRAEQE